MSDMPPTMDASLAAAETSSATVDAVVSEVISIPRLIDCKDMVKKLYEEDGHTLETVLDILTREGIPVG